MVLDKAGLRGNLHVFGSPRAKAGATAAKTGV